MAKAFTTNFWAKGLGTIGVGLAIGLTGCQQKTAKQPTVSADATAKSEQQAALTPNGQSPNGQSSNGQPFLQPTVPQLRPDQMPTLPIKGLTPATRPDSRLSQLSKLNSTVNTRDPFSTLNPGISMIPPVVLPLNPPAAGKTKAKPGATSQKKGLRPISKLNPKIKPLNTNNIAARPLNLQPGRSALPIVSMPAMPMPVEAMPNLPVPVVEQPLEVAPLPPISATSLAEQVEISGVMQVGGKTMVIAKAGNENSARYLQAGDALAGGQVYIKSVRVSAAGEPIVILEQNGVEVTKSIGSSGSRVAALR